MTTTRGDVCDHIRKPLSGHRAPASCTSEKVDCDCHNEGKLTKTTHGNAAYSKYAYDSSDDELEDSGVFYKYDAFGRRAAKKVDSGDWKWYFYDGLKVIAEGTDTDDRTFYTLGPGAIGGIITRDDGTTKYTYMYDRLGNVIALTDDDGDLACVYHTSAFGHWTPYGSSGFNQTISDPQPYHLTTKEYDTDTGLYYFNARWYDRHSGRFVSKDIDRAGRVITPYQYALQNPANAADPTGMYITIAGGHTQDKEWITWAMNDICRLYEEVFDSAIEDATNDYLLSDGMNGYAGSRRQVYCELKKCFREYCGKKQLHIQIGGDYCKPRSHFFKPWTWFKPEEPHGYCNANIPEAGIVVCPKYTNPAYARETIAHEITHLCLGGGESYPRRVGHWLE